MAGLPKGKGDLDPYGVRRDITDPAIRAIAPGPAAAIVEHAQFIAGAQLDNRFRIVGRPGQKRRRGNEVPDERLGIVGRDHSPGEGDVGEILAISVRCGVGTSGGARQGEAVNGR